jgi:peptidoglycan-N-acetylglucosamine deacetylase
MSMSFPLCVLCTLFLAADAAAPMDAGDDAATPDAGDDAGIGVEPDARIAPAVPTDPIAIAGVTTNEPVLALTFDACATKKQSNGFDRKVFEILAREQIPSTFYLSGRWVEKHPSAAKLIAASPWIELGNHTYSHPRLSLMRPERIRMQIRRTNEILKKKVGRPARSLRPPAGAWNAGVVKLADEEHMPVVLWSVISGDVGGHVAAARMKRAVLDQAKPGGIIIFHINKRAPFTKVALPGIIAGLREKGFRFVTVSQLLALPDAVPIKAKPSKYGFRPRNKPHSTEQKEQREEHADPPT